MVKLNIDRTSSSIMVLLGEACEVDGLRKLDPENNRFLTGVQLALLSLLPSPECDDGSADGIGLLLSLLNELVCRRGIGIGGRGIRGWWKDRCFLGALSNGMSGAALDDVEPLLPFNDCWEVARLRVLVGDDAFDDVEATGAPSACDIKVLSRVLFRGM